MVGNVEGRSAILYGVVRENFSSRVEVGGTEWGNQVIEEEETQNAQSLVNHRLRFYYDRKEAIWKQKWHGLTNFIRITLSVEF